MLFSSVASTAPSVLSAQQREQVTMARGLFGPLHAQKQQSVPAICSTASRRRLASACGLKHFRARIFGISTDGASGIPQPSL
jgi:hypothetical protein